LMRALDSVLAQTVGTEALDVIVVDDGSRDDTPERMAAVVARHPGTVRYERQRNAGVAAARNRGFALARGELVALLDSDDIWRKDKLERQLPLFAEDPRTGLVHSEARFVDDDGRPLANYVRRVRGVDGDVLLALFEEFFLLSSAIVLRADVVRRAGGFREDLRVGEDYDYFLRVAELCRVACVRDTLIDRVVRPGSLSRRDYALDARNDLGTLERCLARNPSLMAEHGARVRARLARYRFDLAWRLAHDGRSREAWGEAWRSLCDKPSLAAAKTLVRSTAGMLTGN
ncbi:MAG TPA: glycosyltransferase, partial [Xanthomonadales bacterium]|nr:glycosyltransferase [Xanthomonadales bacterium]